MEALNLTNLTANVNNIQALSDRPNTADGITSQQLKERFDKAGADIKDWANNTLIEELETYINMLKTHIETLENAGYITGSDSRLSDARQCDNTFNYYLEARNNLHITYGTELPSTGEDGDIFFLYS
jgi:hemerythrin-like domain-containing protein